MGFRPSCAARAVTVRWEALPRSVLVRMSEGRTISRALAGTLEPSTREYQIPEVNKTRPGQEAEGQREEGRSLQRDLHKPSHLPPGTILQSAFLNGMVYNNAKL